MTLNKTERPAYQRIEQDLRNRIGTGQLAAGRMLPSRRNLAREYGVALATVERAIENLLDDGTLRADSRRGTFVAEPPGASAAQESASEATSTGLIATAPLTPPLHTAAIGIIATATLSLHPSSPGFAAAESWDSVIVRSLEIALGESGRVSRYIDRSRSRPWMPLREAVATLLADGDVDGFLVLGLHDQPSEIQQLADVVEAAAVPCVYVSIRDSAFPLFHVFYDNVSAGRQAAQHLQRSGYSRLVFFAPWSESWIEERIVGARQAAEANDIPFRVYPPGITSPIKPGSSHRSFGVAAARLALDDAIFTPETGIVAVNDEVALGLLSVAEVAGMRAGQDFGLVGFDNSPEARLNGLTSLGAPLEAMGREAGHLLLRAVSGQRLGTHVRLRAHVIPRASTARWTAPPKGAASEELPAG